MKESDKILRNESEYQSAVAVIILCMESDKILKNESEYQSAVAVIILCI